MMFRAALLVVLCAQASALTVQKDVNKLLKVKEDTVHIAEWWGRLGNNLLQLQNALIYAEAHGKKLVTFPVNHGTELRQLLNLPEKGIVVDPKNMEKKETCLRKAPFFYDDFFHDKGIQSCYPDITVRRRVLVTYVKPLLQHAHDDFKIADDELLIHLRSGDMMRKDGIMHPQTRQPPCSAYDKIIEDGKFQNVRVIGEHDHRNPCFKLLAERHPSINVTVQEKPFSDDAAAIVNAKNLVIGTSSFSLMLGMMNDHLEHAWSAKQTLNSKIVGCGYAKKMTLMNIPGLEKIREYDERIKWMSSFAATKVTLTDMGC